MEGAQEGFAKGREGGRQRREGKAKRFPRRATKDGKGPLRRWRGLERGLPRIAKGRKDIHEAGPRRTGKGKKISTKGHGERRRATKGLEETQEGPTKGREGEKGFPPSGSTKDGKRQKDFHEGPLRIGKGPLRRWRGLERVCQRSGRGSTKKL